MLQESVRSQGKPVGIPGGIGPDPLLHGRLGRLVPKKNVFHLFPPSFIASQNDLPLGRMGFLRPMLGRMSYQPPYSPLNSVHVQRASTKNQIRCFCWAVRDSFALYTVY